jgi:hypothetical protein
MLRALVASALLCVACGSVAGDDPDAAPTVPDAMPAADGALDSHVTWRAANGLPEAACAPWTLLHVPATERPTLDATGFMTLATDLNTDQLFYRQDADVLAEPADGVLVIEARLRFIDGAIMNARSGVHIGFVMGEQSNTLFLTDKGMFLLDSANAVDEPRVDNLPVDGAMHDYRIDVDLTAAAGTDNIRVYRDGSLTLTGHTIADPGRASQLFFGDSSILTSGTGDYASFGHNAHVPVECP